MAKKKNILDNFFNMDENEELNITEEQQYDEELSNILEKEVEKPVVEDEQIIEEKEVNHPPVVEEPKPERKLTDRMKRRLGIK